MAKKRPKWVTWVPASILAALTIAAVVVGLILVRGGLGAPPPAPTAGQVTDLNWSSFTKDGLEYIERSRDVRIDLSEQRESATTIGLPADGTVTIGPNPEGLFYEFIFRGGGVGLGGDKLYVPTLDITTADDEITLIHAPIVDVLTFRDLLNRLKREAGLYGWDTSVVDGIYDMVAQANDAGEPYEFTFGPGTAVGVPVSATAQCDQAAFCHLAYDIGPGAAG